MRLNRYVAQASGLSRRQADQAISEGRVTVDGAVGQTGQEAEAPSQVRLDGQLLRLPQTFRYVALNKPTGYVVSRRQQGTSPTIYRLTADFEGLHPVGRLDKDSSGLLLLSNDGDFIQAASHPSSGKRKIYDLTLSTPLRPSDKERLGGGVELEDGMSRVELIGHQGSEVTVALTEGRNRQLRRTFGALGYEVKRLNRTSFGAISLGNQAVGTWIEYPERPTL